MTAARYDRHTSANSRFSSSPRRATRASRSARTLTFGTTAWWATPARPSSWKWPLLPRRITGAPTSRAACNYPHLWPAQGRLDLRLRAMLEPGKITRSGGTSKGSAQKDTLLREASKALIRQGKMWVIASVCGAPCGSADGDEDEG